MFTLRVTKFSIADTGIEVRECPVDIVAVELLGTLGVRLCLLLYGVYQLSPFARAIALTVGCRVPSGRHYSAICLHIYVFILIIVRLNKNRKGGQIFSVGDYSQEFGKHPGDEHRINDDDIFGALGTVGTIGTVFWGQLADGSQIAVKRLDTRKMKGVKEFSAEAKFLGSIRHKNILTLRGYCAEGKERLLVYDYMINLSLHTHLHGSLSSSLTLNWGRRMTIAIGAAEGLMHLHHKASPPTVHGDIKSNNILLGENYEAKWVDFGIIKLMQEAWLMKAGNEGVMGTYFAPEYLKGGARSLSGDVFGFGILLLELISGKKPLEKMGTHSKSLWEWAEPIIAQGRFNELVDPSLKGHYTRDELNLVVYVAAMCAQSQPGSRLTMVEAVDLLRCGSVCRDRDDDDLYSDYDVEPWTITS